MDTATNESKSIVTDPPTVGQRLDSAIETTHGKAHSIADKTKATFAHGTEVAAQKAGALKHRGQIALCAAQDYAKKNPGKAILAGVATGYLLHALLRRR